jgi:hypothetical protein
MPGISAKAPKAIIRHTAKQRLRKHLKQKKESYEARINREWLGQKLPSRPPVFRLD